MQIKSLKIDNMFCFAKGQELIFKEPVYQVIGDRIGIENQSNGTGKSSIYYVIQEVLFGKNIKKTLKEFTGNVFTDPNSYSGSVSFEHFNKQYIVTLTRKNKKSTLKILENSEDISKHTIPETYKLIQEILGLDYELFTMLTYLSPTISTPNTIFFGTPKEKKNLFTKLFNLSHIVKTVDKAAEKSRELTVELKASTKQINSIEDITIPKLPPPPNFIELEEARKEKGVLLASQERMKVMIQGHNSWKVLLHNKVELETKLQGLESYEYDPKILKQLKELAAAADLTYQTQKNNLIELSNKQTHCPTCKRKYDNVEDIAKIISPLKTLVAELKEKYLLAKDNLTAYWKIENLDILKNQYSKELEQVNIRIKDFDPSIQSIGEAESKFNKNLEELIKINNFISLLDLQVTKYRQIEGEIKTLVQFKKDQNVKKEELTILIKELEQNVQIYNTIKDHLGIDGFISTKITIMASRLTFVINQYLEIFSNNSLYIKNNKLQFKLLKDGKELPINNLSAGQLTMIQLSSILALRDLITMNKGITIDLLVLDELFGTLDEVRRGILTDTLRDISIGGKHKVLSISHLTNDPSLPTIKIVQEHGISKIKQ